MLIVAHFLFDYKTEPRQPIIPQLQTYDLAAKSPRCRCGRVENKLTRRYQLGLIQGSSSNRLRPS